MFPINDALSFSYRNKYATAQTPPNLAIAVANAAQKINDNALRFKAVASAIAPYFPFELVGVLAMRELSPPFNFYQHLSNGDPLTAKTVHVPVGIPHDGFPPYTFEQGAIAGLESFFERWGVNPVGYDWSIANSLCFLECWNGLGYRKRFADNEQGSPYLWNFTQHYRRGYYRADGKFDENLTCESIGCAPVLKRLSFRC